MNILDFMQQGNDHGSDDFKPGHPWCFPKTSMFRIDIGTHSVFHRIVDSTVTQVSFLKKRRPNDKRC